MPENRNSQEIPLSDEGEQQARMGSSPQYASGGAVGMQMTVSLNEPQNPYTERGADNIDRDDFLMIQLSSFEGRAGH